MKSIKLFEEYIANNLTVSIIKNFYNSFLKELDFKEISKEQYPVINHYDRSIVIYGRDHIELETNDTILIAFICMEQLGDIYFDVRGFRISENKNDNFSFHIIDGYNTNELNDSKEIIIRAVKKNLVDQYIYF